MDEVDDEEPDFEGDEPGEALEVEDEEPEVPLSPVVVVRPG